MKISVIGAGNVGATLSQRIVESGLADVVLLDILKDIAQGKSLDIMHAAPLLGHERSVIGTDDYREIDASDIIVITAGFPRQPGMRRLDLIQKNKTIIKDVVKNIKRHSPGAIIIVVTNPLDAMTWLVLKESGLKPNRVMGMAGALDRSRLIYLIAKAMNAKYKDIETIIVGEHGEGMVPLLGHTKVSGKPIKEILPKERIDELKKRSLESGAAIVKLLCKGGAYYAPSAACFSMIKSIVKNEKALMSVSCMAKGEYGLSDLCIGLPVILGKNGIEEIVKLKLDKEELKSLKKSADAIKEQIAALYE